MKLAIIDIIGIPYDGTTVFKQGLGGSESAVTLMGKELSDLGFEVTVFNNCIDHAQPGVYDGVTYRHLNDLAQDHYFDIVISSRTVIPFVPPERYEELRDGRAWPYHSMNLYDRILSKAKMRILWMHDTFCLGDSLIEDLALADRITDIFTLSDWHTTYILNCDHGKRRNFEVLKRKVFITRNGAKNYNREVDIKAKDPNLFVYNASVTKGMIPLIQHVWPRVKHYLPEAKLKVIGGYYKFSEKDEPDQQEKDWRNMAFDPANGTKGIEFTGIIPQSQIADILSNANFMIYPAAFPETYGISTLESLMYNTPSITCRFGGLEEIALENACYLIDYAIEPNSLFQNINVGEQVDKFVKTVVDAYHNKYLHQQKQYYCNIIKDIAGWDSVAQQWRQHMYKQCGEYLSAEDYRAVSKINHRLHKIYKRRFHNVVELEDYKCGSEQPIVVISPFYNAEAYIEKCIASVAQQDYNNYHHILIDDCSTDNGFNRAVEAVYKLPKSMLSKFSVIKNTENKGAHRNQIETIRQLTDNDAIIMILDGDDSLVNDNTIFSYYNTIYDGSTEFTYGSCWSMVDSIPLISQPYPDAVKQAKSYRQHHFNWILPYTHLRTFKKHLVNGLPDQMFTDDSGNWYKAGGDGAVFYAIIEQADPNKVKCLQDIVYNYNDINPINDYKVNGEEQNRAARSIIEKKTSNKPIMNNTNILTSEYQLACSMPSDINQHLPLLNKLANECATVVELGVRTGVSTRALLASTCRLYSYDLELYPTVVDLFNVAKSMQKPCEYQIGNSLTMEIPETDMLFIDTDHTYQQLSAELARHHTKVKKYIAFHDTFTYGLKTGQDPLKGIFTAIVEFMTDHPEWKFKYHTSENNGFTVIERTEIKQLPVQVDETQYSIIVPTMWRVADQFVEFVNRLCAEQRVGEVIIINNDNTKTPQGLSHPKIRMFDFGRNIYVNPAWNLGVKESRFSRICIVNDDVVFDTAIFERLQNMLTEDNGLFGLCPGIDVFNQPPVTDKTIDVVPWSGQHTYGYGCLFFFHKKVWQPIPQGLDIYFGDNWAFDLQLVKGRRNYIISNMDFYSQFAATTIDQSITGGFLERERPIYEMAITELRNPSPVLEPVIVPKTTRKKRILIGIPTAKNIETETFKAIYDLEVPDGYETEFQCFYGYNIDQVRNLIAHWAIHYDYLFSVDSDIAFEKDTLKKLLAHDKDLVSGLYIQRKPGQHVLEIYEHNQQGGVSNMHYSKLKDRNLVEIAACGFGCVLVKSEVFAAVGYPQFEYHSAIDHAHTISEDNDFCRKALAKGFHIYADPSIQCRHIGSATFTVDNNIPAIYDNPVEDRLRFINSNLMIPTRHVEYLARIKTEYNFVPKVIYDIGACVLHWTDAARTVWHDSDYVAFEAMEAAEFLYKEKGVKYHIGLLSDQNGREVGFYENTENPAGNSYYRENSEFSAGADILYTEGHRKVKHGITLDTVVRNKAFPLPDFIKMDVQGAELDVLNGAINTLKSAKHVILELQRVEYNKGAPLSNVLIEWMNQHGFDCKGEFCDNGPDSDYHFVNRS